MPNAHRVLPLDSRVSDVGMLRFVAAVIAVIGAVWLMFVRPPAWAWLGVVSGFFFAFFWFRRWAASRLVADAPAENYLGLRADGLHIAAAGGVEVVSWDRVEAVEADEERVAVRIELADEDDARYVEPIYGGLGLYELEAAIRSARDASPAHER